MINQLRQKLESFLNAVYVMQRITWNSQNTIIFTTKYDTWEM